ncbi:M15 family metallopeptidase [Anoxybacillus tepidamans]|uniref:M15 family metallopeptidase n=1 Tax=Anoxybacteroides tepidamans TaxID=265948 RepID=UPI000686B8D7|nr:M15 family metallopeptidase [Anoxybacillus tepidamans]
MKKDNKILMSDPVVSSTHVRPSQEPFVNLIHFDRDIVVDPSLSNRSRYFSCVRFSVAEKLSTAKALLPKGVRFLVKEGYRPLHIQQLAFERALQRAKKSFPNEDLNYWLAEASKYVAPPDVAPHPTGGAIDLTLIDANGNELDLGTQYDAIPQETNYATFFDATNISKQAMQNRQMLAYALQSVGFVNYFTEWWHWSYGDKYWAVMTNADWAVYPPVSEQELVDLL